MFHVNDSTSASEVAEASTSTQLIERLRSIPELRFHRNLYRWLGIGLISVAYSTLIISFTIESSAATFGFNPNKNSLVAGLLINLGFVGQAIGALLFGLLAERYGRKWTYVSALLIAGIGGILAAFAWSLPVLVVLRVIQSIGLGAILPLAITLFTEFVPPQRRSRSGLLLACWYAWGTFLVPLLASRSVALFGDGMGWRVALFLGSFVPFLGGVFCWFLLPESVEWLVRNKARYTQAEKVVVGLEQETSKLGKALQVVPDAAMSYVADQKPTRWVEIFAPPFRRNTWLLWSQWFLAYFLVTAFSNGLPLFFRYFGLQRISLLLTIFYGFATLGTVYIFAFGERFGGYRRWMMGAYLLAVGVACASILGTVAALPGLLVFLVSLLLCMGGFIVAYGLYVFSGVLFPTRMRAWALSTGRAVQCFGTLIAPFITPVVFQYAGVVGLFLFFGLLALVGWGVLFVAGERS